MLSGTKYTSTHAHTHARTHTNLLPCRQSTQRTHSYSILGSAPAHVVEGYRQRAVAVQQVVRHHEGEGGRDAEVSNEADEQRGDDADRDGSLGVLHLLTYCTRGRR